MTEKQVLNPQQAINILVQAVNLGQKAGVYSLDDAAIIKQAVDIFVKKDEDKTKEPSLKAVKGDGPKAEAPAEAKPEAKSEAIVAEIKKEAPAEPKS